ncbi:MAG: DUF3883 domain-containing protein [Chromatiaceae bacterium]
MREEFNRAEALENDKRAGTVGFALTILQRRLASSPEAIYQSLRRRRERLEGRLRELEVLHRGGQVVAILANGLPALDSEDVEDLDEAPDNEVAAAEETILDQATAARSIAELRIEIETLKGLEAQALAVRRSGNDTKWCELASLLGEIFTPASLGHRIEEPRVPDGSGPIPPPTPSPHQKLVIFTEHRDTLNYLESRITTLLGRKDAVVIIHGGIGREERLKVQESFKHDPDVQVLLATDAILERPESQWIGRELEQKAQGYAIAHVVPEHLADVKGRKLELLAKTEAAVKDRLTKEITYWDHRAEELKLQEQAGKPNAKLNSGEARKRADLLQGRLQKRLEDLKLEAQLSPLPPVVLGGSLVVPMGLLEAMTGQPVPQPTAPVDTQASAARARAIVMDIERGLGFDPTDREFDKLGYDIESRVPGTGGLRFIEVKGRVSGAPTITVTRNEILYSLNKPDDFILAIVEFLDDETHRVHYLRQPFGREPDFGVTSVNYDFAELLARADAPR